MTEPIGGFIHRHEPAAVEDAPTLLLLHGTGGNEHDLIPLGKALVPGAGLLSLRGQVLERGMPRFFRRLAEGVFDQEDLTRRTHELAGFVEEAARYYRFNPAQVIAVGFSNGANIAASLLLLHPGRLHAAILFRAMVPLEPDPLPTLPGTAVYLGAGRFDPIVPAENSARLADLLGQAGAVVTLDWRDEGHHLSPSDVSAAADWLVTRFQPPAAR
jgi:phospholipase/carboxylesterase